PRRSVLLVRRLRRPRRRGGNPGARPCRRAALLRAVAHVRAVSAAHDPGVLLGRAGVLRARSQAVDGPAARGPRPERAPRLRDRGSPPRLSAPRGPPPPPPARA